MPSGHSRVRRTYEQMARDRAAARARAAEYRKRGVVTLSTLVATLGVGRRTISRWVDQGMPTFPIGEGRQSVRYVLGDVRRWATQQRKRARSSGPVNEPPESNGPVAQEAKRRVPSRDISEAPPSLPRVSGRQTESSAPAGDMTEASAPNRVATVRLCPSSDLREIQMVVTEDQLAFLGRLSEELGKAIECRFEPVI